jgi:hypothetical protein
VVTTGKPYPEVMRYEREKSFEDPNTKGRTPFPSLGDEPSTSLSVIVPAFNEEERCECWWWNSKDKIHLYLCI